MLTTPSNEFHALWGRSFPSYFKSYTNQALAAPLSPLEETNVRAQAAKTVEWIIALGKAPKNSRHGAARYITLSMLKSILDATKIPEEIKRLADPRLVRGCVELMASVEPVFGYEYGYVCFQILNLVISACLLERVGRLDITIQRMGSASDNRLVFWSDAAAVVSWDIRSRGRIIPGLYLLFTEDALDRLMNLLHGNQKQYFIVLKVLESMGLSGLMLALRAHIQVGGVMSNNTKCGDMVESRVQPFSRLLWRYLLSVPAFIEHEARAVYEIQYDVTYWARFRDSHFVDVEDSRNLLQALNEKLVSFSMPQLTPVMTLLRFVEPLVVPGCENLVPTLVERCLRLMWNAIENNDGCSNTARIVITSVLTLIRYIFQEIKPKSFHHQQWIVQLVDTIVNESLTDLVLRALVTSPDFVPGQQDVTERLYNISFEFYEDLVHLVPRSYLASRLHDSGALADWHKYVTHFLGTEDALRETHASSVRSSRRACGEAIIHTLVVVFDKERVNEFYSAVGSCDNPRCPMPCDAAYICAECIDLVYCSTKCLTADWLSPWRGVHKRVCQQQTMSNPKSRTSYHQNIVDIGRKDIRLAERNDMDVQDMVLSYHCDESEWLPF